jgi:type VI secretion system protein ImpA
LALQLEELLAPVSEDAPGGEDLFEDPGRQQLEQAFEEEATSVDWRDVLDQISAQSARSKDVWLAVYLTRAGAQMGQLATVVTGAQMLAGLFDTYWDTMHPSLEEYGFQGRKGPCESLTRIGAFLGPLKRVALVEHQRLGSYSGEDFQRFAQEGDTAEGFGMFRKALEDVEEGALQTAIDSLDSLREAIRRVDSILVANADGDTGTDFTATYEAIESIRRAVAPYAGIVAEEAEVSDAGGAASAEASGGPRIAGKVDSREDVVKALDAIAEYYQRREPASPIPIALRRIRGWVSMDFMAVLRDIAPNSVSEAGTVLLARPEEEY